MTQTEPAGPPAPQPARPLGRNRRDLGRYVAGVVHNLQDGYMKNRAGATAALARLRAAAGSPAGSRLDVLEWTAVPANLLPDTLGDGPTRQENAAHAALTLYAVHQQSYRERGLHRDGIGLGQAVARLAHASPSPDPVRRRFAALGTAPTFAEAIHHTRGLIRQLRDHRIALDYGLLADDLLAFQYPGGAERVRGMWGREFYRTIPDASTSDTAESMKETP